MGNKYDPFNLFLETYSYEDWFKNEELTYTTRNDKDESVDLSDMSPVEGDEEVKEGKRIKNINSKQTIN